MNKKFYFTADYEQTMSRNRYLAGGLIRNGYKVIKGIPASDDRYALWFHGLSLNEKHPITPEYLQRMHDFEGSLVFFMNDDHDDFHWFKIPPNLIGKASGFYRNHWKASSLPDDSALLAKTGLVNPILRPLNCLAGKNLIDRKKEVFFIGKPTGDLPLTTEANQRLKGVSLLKDSGLPFYGGIIAQGNTIPSDLKSNQLFGKEYWNKLSDTAIVLALWGYSPITYRFWEGLANRNLVIAPDFSDYFFASSKTLIPGIHYVSVKPDLSDLVDICRYYLSNTAEAQTIADNGFDWFKKNASFQGINFPQGMMSEIVSSWKLPELTLNHPSGLQTLSYMAKSFLLSKRKRW